jgi:hypothetical protein
MIIYFFLILYHGFLNQGILSLSFSSGDGQMDATITVERNGRNSYD